MKFHIKEILRSTPIPLLLSALSIIILVGCKPSGTGNANSSQKADTEQLEHGAQIVDEYRKRDFAPFRTSRIRLTVVEPEEPKDVYELEVWRSQTPDSRYTLTHVLKPATQRRVAALTIEGKARDVVNISYDGMADEFRESGSDDGAAGGVTIGELLGDWDKYNLRFLGEKEVDGIKGYEVEGKLKSGQYSNLARVTTLFRADNYLPHQARIFDTENKELRTFRITEQREVLGRPVIWRLEIDNHENGAKLTIEMLDVNFPEKLDDQAFTRDHLKQIAKKG